jgi:O-antigen/teichoic acid export membrane protein
MTASRTIARNASWLLMATTAQKFLAFVAFTAAARIVGPGITGEYFYAVAITSTFVVIGDLGITPVVIRAIAADTERGRHLLGAAFRIKAGLIPVAILTSLAYAMLRNATPVVFITVCIMTLVMTADSLHLTYYGVLRGKQKLRFEALGMFVGQVLTTIVAVSAAMLGWGAPGLASALLIASVWNLGWSSLNVGREKMLGEKPTRADVRSLMHQALPFAFAGIFVKVYSYLDTMILEAFHTKAVVGNYAVAYKVTYAFQFIPLVFIAALYPAMSSVFAKKDHEELKRVFAGSLRIMAVCGAPIAAGLSAIAPRFIPLLYDVQFLGAVAPLTILPWVLLPIFIDFPVGSLLNATNRAHLKTASMGAAMVVNAILNVLLVPTYGPVGAAIAGVGSFSFLLFAGIAFARRELPSFGWFVWLVVRSMITGAVLWIAVRTLGAAMPFALAVLFGAAVGVTCLLVLKLLTMEDLRAIYRWLHARVRATNPQREQLHG